MDPAGSGFWICAFFTAFSSIMHFYRESGSCHCNVSSSSSPLGSSVNVPLWGFPFFYPWQPLGFARVPFVWTFNQMVTSAVDVVQHIKLSGPMCPWVAVWYCCCCHCAIVWALCIYSTAPWKPFVFWGDIKPWYLYLYSYVRRVSVGAFLLRPFLSFSGCTAREGHIYNAGRTLLKDPFALEAPIIRGGSSATLV